MKLKLRRKHVRTGFLIIAAVSALPIPPGTLNGFVLWTSPWLFLMTVLGGTPFVRRHIIGVAVLIMLVLDRRWYCRWLCPVGVACDAVSTRRKPSRFYRRIPAVGGMLALAGPAAALMGLSLAGVLDPVVIFFNFFDAVRLQSAWPVIFKLSGLTAVLLLVYLVPLVWCQKICPLGGFADFLFRMRKFFTQRSEYVFNGGRRWLLGAGVGLAAGAVLGPLVGRFARRPLRPPGALPEARFRTTCLRCGNCVQVCPTAILHPYAGAAGISALWTPEIKFSPGYCRPDCTACGTACPSGAIRRFSRNDKHRLIIGRAIVARAGCLLGEGKECSLCRRYCDYDAVKIVRSEKDFSAHPEIVHDRCVGCGACVVVCPVGVIGIRWYG